MATSVVLVQEEVADKLIEQLRMLRRIDGNFPILRAATQSHNNTKGTFIGRITDPDDYANDAIDFPIDYNIYFRDYYKYIYSLLLNGSDSIKLEK